MVQGQGLCRGKVRARVKGRVWVRILFGEMSHVPENEPMSIGF